MQEQSTEKFAGYADFGTTLGEALERLIQEGNRSEYAVRRDARKNAHDALASCATRKRGRQVTKEIIE